jgi:hypothetical protein
VEFKISLLTGTQIDINGQLQAPGKICTADNNFLSTEEVGCAVEGRTAHGDKGKHSCPYAVVYHVFKPGQKSNFIFLIRGHFLKFQAYIYRYRQKEDLHVQLPTEGRLTCTGTDRRKTYMYSYRQKEDLHVQIPTEGSLTCTVTDRRKTYMYRYR